MSQPPYDVAQVCPNGHVATSFFHDHPQHREEHCSECGEATITSCPSCSTPIRGGYREWGFHYSPPSFCIKCGSPFPWTERRQQAAIELFIEESMDKADQDQFKESIAQITKDTPQAQVAAGRLVKLLNKIGTEAAGLIRTIIGDIASEAVRGRF